MPWPEKLVTPVLACLAGLSFPVAQGADHPPAQKPAVTDTAPANSAVPALMVTQNPDGTFTVRKEPPKGDANGFPRGRGLVIPAQVVVPIIPRAPRPPVDSTGNGAIVTPAKR
jgi:hypothetical protein